MTEKSEIILERNCVCEREKTVKFNLKSNFHVHFLFEMIPSYEGIKLDSR